MSGRKIRDDEYNSIFVNKYNEEYKVLEFLEKRPNGYYYNIQFIKTGNTYIKSSESILKKTVRDEDEYKRINKENNNNKVFAKRKKMNSGNNSTDEFYGKIFIENKTILVLDQASQITGYSVFIDGKLITYGVMQSKNQDIHKRLKEMKNDLQILIEKYKPDYVIMEDIYLEKNLSVYRALAGTAFIFVDKIMDYNIPIIFKKAVEWKGHFNLLLKNRELEKKKGIELIKQIYGVDVTDDISDSILLGLYVIDLYKVKFF